MEPFSSREIRFLNVREADGWSLKVYSVRYGVEPMDWDGFEPAIALAEESLPSPDSGAGRPGLGFLLAHQGRTGDYLVLGWWNHENELPLKVWVRRRRSEEWRPAIDGESFCVWDLEVIWEERSAWVETMLSSGRGGRASYLARVAPRFST